MSEDRVVTINVGGKIYVTKVSTLLKESNTMFEEYFGKSREDHVSSDNGKWDRGIIVHGIDQYFIDRDGDLFRYVLNYLRTGTLLLPKRFLEINQLLEEASFFKIGSLVDLLQQRMLRETATANQSTRSSVESFQLGGGYITVGYRGTFTFGRNSHVEVKFRKINRILICGRAELCKEVFSDALNESRDPERVAEKSYTSRMFLKHNSLESAFDALYNCGFTLITSCGSGASTGIGFSGHVDNEEQKWNHYNEFIFFRPGETTSFGLDFTARS